MDSTTFIKFRNIVYEKSGITLKEGKEALVCARVGKRMRALNIDDYRAYLRYVSRDENSGEVVHLIDAISTNVTSFFREADNIDFFGKAVSNWFEQGQRRFRFWSSACSSGEEPYSIAITLDEILKDQNADKKILATDISTRILDMAKAGKYSPKQIDTVPLNQRERYFNVSRYDHTTTYSVKDSLKKGIVFARLNLSSPPFPMSGPFDAIFCRNVMIYFDNVVRKNLIDEIHRLLKPGGYLIVGSAESLTGMVSGFKSVKSSIYIKE